MHICLCSSTKKISTRLFSHCRPRSYLKSCFALHHNRPSHRRNLHISPLHVLYAFDSSVSFESSHSFSSQTSKLWCCCPHQLLMHLHLEVSPQPSSIKTRNLAYLLFLFATTLYAHPKSQPC